MANPILTPGKKSQSPIEDLSVQSPLFIQPLQHQQCHELGLLLLT